MWGSLARNITSTVGDAVKTTASTVAPTAGDVLRRVGEVVAPTDEYSSEESEYESGEDVDENEEGEEENVDFEEDNLLDRYRKGAAFLTSPFRSDQEEVECTEDAAMNGSTDALEEEPQLSNQQVNKNHFSEDQEAGLAARAEQLQQQRIEVEAEQTRLKAQQLEQQRLEQEAEQDRIRAEAAGKQRLEEEVRKEAERAQNAAIEADRLRAQQEQAQLEQERKEREEAERQRLEQEEKIRQFEEERMAIEQRKEEERLAKAEQERLALEKKREAARLAELKQQELEREKAEEQARIEAEKRAAAETEQQRLAVLKEQELEKKRAEEQRQAELKQMEMDRKNAEEMAAKAERERMALEKRLENERLAQEAKEAAEERKIEMERLQQQAAEMQKNQQQLESVQRDANESHAKLTTIQQENKVLQSSNDQLQSTVDQLKIDLHRAAETIAELRIKIAQQEDDERKRLEEESLRLQQEETEMVESVKSDMEKQLAQLKDSFNAQIIRLETELEEERKSSLEQQHELQKRLEEATSRLTASESEMTAQLMKKEAKLTKQLQSSEKAAAKAVSLLDQKEEEVSQLNAVIADMRETMKKNKVAEDEAEEEMDELHHENEELHAQLEAVKKENATMKARLASMADDSEKLGGLKMEMQLLEEERQREKALLESANEASSENFIQVSSERDAAKARVQDLEQQLAAAQVDVEIANSDKDRALLASENLQRALEAIQNERDSEIALLMEQRNSADEAMAAAHAVEIESIRQANIAEMKDVQYAADKSVQNSLVEMDKMESTIQECKKDNLNLRRALDEAIARLQTSQEDVIDRNLIKNIILDWHAKKGKAKRDVMILLGSILHFTEDEKDKAYISDGPGTLDKVVNAVAAPLPASKLNVDKIEGDNIRDKWVNFLLAETGDDDI